MARRDAFSGYRSPESFWKALRGVWLLPGRFFRGLDPHGGVVRPTLFVALVLYLNLLFETVLQAVWLREVTYALLYAPLLGFVVSLVLAPFLVAGTSALVLTVLDGAPSRTKFVPLFRALAYAAGTGCVFWIPYASTLAIPYGAYVATIAVHESVGAGWGRAATATLIPLAALLIAIGLLIGPTEAYGVLVNPPGS